MIQASIFLNKYLHTLLFGSHHPEIFRICRNIYRSCPKNDPNQRDKTNAHEELDNDTIQLYCPLSDTSNRWNRHTEGREQSINWVPGLETLQEYGDKAYS